MSNYGHPKRIRHSLILLLCMSILTLVLYTMCINNNILNEYIHQELHNNKTEDTSIEELIRITKQELGTDHQQQHYFTYSSMHYPQPPNCPPHPSIKSIKYPYNYVKSLHNTAKLVCRGNSSSRVIHYNGTVIEYRNVILDFTKRSFENHASKFNRGFIAANCNLSHDSIWNWDELSQSLISSDIRDYDEEVEDSVIVVKRDDCGNVWHALADFLTVFNGGVIANIPPEERRVLILDGRLMISDSPDDNEKCPYHGSLEALGRRGVDRGIQFMNKRVKFKKLVLPLREERGNDIMSVIWDMLICDGSEIIGRYVDNLFDYFNLSPLSSSSSAAADNIRITFSSRRKKPFSADNQIGRIILNEKELVDEISNIPNVTVQALEFFEIPFLKQLEIFRNTDILIGMHGAGLTNIVYTPHDSVLIELIPFTWESQEYFSLAGMTGRSYFRWRNEHKDKHIEPDCLELESKHSPYEGGNICRTATTSQTVATIEEIIPIVKKAIDKVRSNRG